MTKFRLFLVVACVMCAVFLPVSMQSSANADGSWEIRFATIAPDGTKPMRILRAWDKTVQDATGKRAKFRFYAGGQAGDERDVIRKMRVKQIEAATLTSVGLGQIVKSASVLQVPGLFKNYKELAAVRAAMDEEWRKAFENEGYVLLGWFDIGFGRVFSSQPIEKPSDFKKGRPWVWRDDPVFPELLKVVGANGVPLALGEVFPALQTKMVDTVIASPVAALGLQWFNNVSYMSKQADVALVGATLLRKDLWDSMPPDVQKALMDNSKKAHDMVLKLVESEENEAYNTLKKRGIKEVDQAPHAAEWDKAYKAVQTSLVSKQVFPKEVLERVNAAIATARK
jgi:TRAP-type C4-dicarboxylate transport system substrate-binding protein